MILFTLLMPSKQDCVLALSLSTKLHGTTPMRPRTEGELFPQTGLDSAALEASKSPRSPWQGALCRTNMC